MSLHAFRRRRRRRSSVRRLIPLTVACAPALALAGPINSDVAFTPRKGGSILRLQYSYSEAGPRDEVRHVNSSGVQGTYVYGLEENLALFFTARYANQQVDQLLPNVGRVERAHDGVGDFSFLVKYRFWQRDTGPLETYRWAALGGLNVRSGDSDFSSDSYDPILGTVFTFQRDRNLWDADLIYQFNTGRDEFRHDVLRYDLAYSYRLFPVVFEPGENYEWNAVVEANGRYSTDGSHEVFLSPGMQFVTEQWALEASVQLPVVQEFEGPETEYRFVIGLRFQW